MYSEDKKARLVGEFSKEIKLEKIHCKFVSDRDREILTQIGVADSMSPYISLATEEIYAGYSLYDRVKKFEEYDIDNIQLKTMCFLGHVDFGYIVLTDDGKVQIFDYDREELVECNSSLDAFLDCCYEYMIFVEEIQKKYGEDALFEGLYNEDDVKELESKMRFVDRVALEDGFWLEQIDALIEDIM